MPEVMPADIPRFLETLAKAFDHYFSLFSSSGRVWPAALQLFQA